LVGCKKSERVAVPPAAPVQPRAVTIAATPSAAPSPPAPAPASVMCLPAADAGAPVVRAVAVPRPVADAGVAVDPEAYGGERCPQLYSDDSSKVSVEGWTTDGRYFVYRQELLGDQAEWAYAISLEAENEPGAPQ